MTQDANNPKLFIADKGKVFKRIHNGFTEIGDGIILGNQLILGNILVDSLGNPLETPIADKIDYYMEIDAPERKHRDFEGEMFLAAEESVN